jgi:hypothetical protein
MSSTTRLVKPQLIVYESRLNFKMCWLPQLLNVLALVDTGESSPCFCVGNIAQRFHRGLESMPNRATLTWQVFSCISTEVLQHRARLVTRQDHDHRACRQQPNTQLLPGNWYHGTGSASANRACGHYSAGVAWIECLVCCVEHHSAGQAATNHEDAGASTS